MRRDSRECRSKIGGVVGVVLSVGKEGQMMLLLVVFGCFIVEGREGFKVEN